MSKSKFPVGSSSKIAGVPATKALAIATRCCCPPDNLKIFRKLIIAFPYSALYSFLSDNDMSGQRSVNQTVIREASCCNIDCAILSFDNSFKLSPVNCKAVSAI